MHDLAVWNTRIQWKIHLFFFKYWFFFHKYFNLHFLLKITSLCQYLTKQGVHYCCWRVYITWKRISRPLSEVGIQKWSRNLYPWRDDETNIWQYIWKTLPVRQILHASNAISVHGDMWPRWALNLKSFHHKWDTLLNGLLWCNMYYWILN